jgi:hypothetical protein
MPCAQNGAGKKFCRVALRNAFGKTHENSRAAGSYVGRLLITQGDYAGRKN